MISVILVEIENPGNLGAVARIMKNFNQKNLILISPKCKKSDQEARNRAKHANDILKSAMVIRSFQDLKGLDYLVATTASLGTDYNVPRSPITPVQFAEKLSKLSGKQPRIGLLIGRESTGLTNEEIRLADFIVTIPSSSSYPTLNISHSLAIILYEISKLSKTKSVSSHILFAKNKEKQVIEKNLSKILNKLQFQTDSKKQTQKVVWKRIIGKSFLTKREAFAVIGFFKKIYEKISKSKK